MPYPTSFPTESALALAGYLRGETGVPIPTLIEHAYDLLGYGLRLGIGDGKPALMQGMPPSDEDAANQLMQLAKTTAHGVKPLVGALPGWLVPFAIDLFTRLLAAWQKG